MSERQNGWYWVKEHISEDWAAWYWNGDDFRGQDEECFAVIGDRIPTPDDPWQCVPVEPTAEMIEAAREQHEGDAYLPASLHRAMLAAAPKP